LFSSPALSRVTFRVTEAIAPSRSLSASACCSMRNSTTSERCRTVPRCAVDAAHHLFATVPQLPTDRVEADRCPSVERLQPRFPDVSLIREPFYGGEAQGDGEQNGGWEGR
jgi:hypothetical protein